MDTDFSVRRVPSPGLVLRRIGGDWQGDANTTDSPLMHLVQMLLPVRDNAGKPFPPQLFDRIRRQLTERFGGITAYLQAPAEGLWRDSLGELKPDEVVIFEIMCDELDRAWWAQFREELADELGQQELVTRALPIEIL